MRSDRINLLVSSFEHSVTSTSLYFLISKSKIISETQSNERNIYLHLLFRLNLFDPKVAIICEAVVQEERDRILNAHLASNNVNQEKP